MGIGRMLRRLSIRRLRLRAAQLMDLSVNPLATVYPQPLMMRAGSGLPVMILAPHADDETFGAGGTIALHCAAGDRVCVVLFSDNEESIIDDSMTGPEKIAQRSMEFHRAMDVLGVESRHELGIPRAAFRGKGQCRPLRELLIGNRPQVLYLPSLFDNHEDHRVVNLWAAEELSCLPQGTCIVRAYEVWSPLTANIVVDISDSLNEKKRAMECYTSQLQTIDYAHHILGLNAYRAITEPAGVRFAEVFYETTAETYVALVTKYLNT